MKHLVFALACLFVLSACNFFSDLEAEHPFEPGPCDDCPASCVDGECRDDVGCDPECAAGEECVEGRCELTDECDDPADPTCDDPNASTCATDPDRPECAEFKQCPSGEEVQVEQPCPCEEERRCVCDLETGECLVCPEDVGSCECFDEEDCPGGICDDFQCADDAPSTICLVDGNDPNCEPCQGVGSCPQGYDCYDEEGVCYRFECGLADAETCVHVCDVDQGRCPGGQTCEDTGVCVGQCACPMDLMCEIDNPVCRDADGGFVECQSDEGCAPGLCVDGICIGG